MGSYASQLSRKQRWMISSFIKTKQMQSKGGNPTAPAIPQGDTTQSRTTPENAQNKK
jgi:hypothetical protein